VSADVSDLPLRVVLILAAFASGLIDAASYLGLGHVFTANMTGNILLLGFAVAGASGFSTSACLVSVGAFLVGAGVGPASLTGICAPPGGGSSSRSAARES